MNADRHRDRRRHGRRRAQRLAGAVPLGAGVAFAQIGVVGFDGQIELEALRLYGLPEAAPALPCGTPALPVGQREFAAEVSWDLPSLAPGATSLLDVTVTDCRQGDPANAALVSSTRFIELDAAAWTTDEVEQSRLGDQLLFCAGPRATARGVHRSPNGFDNQRGEMK